MIDLNNMRKLIFFFFFLTKNNIFLLILLLFLHYTLRDHDILNTTTKEELCILLNKKFGLVQIKNNENEETWFNVLVISVKKIISLILNRHPNLKYNRFKIKTKISRFLAD